jgi:hypothetical protein
VMMSAMSGPGQSIGSERHEAARMCNMIEIIAADGRSHKFARSLSSRSADEFTGA